MDRTRQTGMTQWFTDAARIAALEARLSAIIDAKQGFLCGMGFGLGTCPCDECVEHREDLTLLGRPVPDVVNGLSD